MTGGTTLDSVGGIAALIPSFERSCALRTRPPKTIGTYGESARQLVSYLGAHGMPTQALHVWREHVEMFMAHLVATRSAATAILRLCSSTPGCAWPSSPTCVSTTSTWTEASLSCAGRAAGCAPARSEPDRHRSRPVPEGPRSAPPGRRALAVARDQGPHDRQWRAPDGGAPRHRRRAAPHPSPPAGTRPLSGWSPSATAAARRRIGPSWALVTA